MFATLYDSVGPDARRAFWLTFAGFCLDAMDIQLFAFVLPVLMPLWQLSTGEAGLLSAISLASSALGGWIAGVLADRVGRVRVLTVSVVWLAIATCACGIASDAEQLMVARALQGLGFGGEWAVGAVFLAEVSSAETRGRLVGMAQSAWAVGWGAAAILTSALTAYLPPRLGWRCAFFVGLAPALVVYTLRRRAPEPRIFVQTGRPWHAIFARSARGATLRGSLLAVGMHGGYWAIATWWPSMLRTERGLSGATSTSYMGVLIVGAFFGYLCGAWLGDRLGRRPTLAGFAVAGAVLVAVCTLLPCSDRALLCWSFPLGFFTLGMFSLIGPVLTELFPTSLRGSGMGFCYNFGRGVAGLTPWLVGMRAEDGHIGRALTPYVACAYGVILIAVALLAETRGSEMLDAET